MDHPILELRGVTYALNGRRILDTVSWRIEKGEHWAILGPNGAGKTTLLRMMCGFLWPNRGGEVFRKGERLLDLYELRKSIGWVTSALTSSIPKWERVLYTVVSGKFAQIGYWSTGNRGPHKKDLMLAQQYLEEMECAALANSQFGNLSQGEQQRVLIARARMAAPYLIVLDEPCAGLDPKGREVFLASLQNLGKQRTSPSLVYVTHHLEEIMPIFQKTMILKEGQVIGCGQTADLLKAQTIRRLYGLSVRIVKRSGRYWPICA
jgi:iron complex transport system ATP-binding protein